MRDIQECPDSEAVVAGDWEESQVLKSFSLKEKESDENLQKAKRALETYKKKYREWKKADVAKHKEFTTVQKAKIKLLEITLTTVKPAQKLELEAQLAAERLKYYSPISPPFPGSGVKLIDILDIVAEGETIEKPYDVEALVDLIELNQRLKSSVMIYARNSVGLGIDFRRTHNTEVAELSKDELEDYKEQGRALVEWFNSRVEIGTHFSQLAYAVMYAKAGLGEGYFEIIDSNNGKKINQIRVMSSVNIWEHKNRDRYVWIKNGKKRYYKKFNDMTARNAEDFNLGAPLEKRATRLLPFREFNLLSEINGVPMWSGSIPQVIGARYAEERNVSFFLNDAPQPLDSKILTPDGWKSMGDVTIGSYITGKDGKAHKVTGILPQGKQDVYTVTFFDGSTTKCALNHTWTVSNNYDRQLGITRDLTLQELLDEGLYYDSGPAKWAVPMNDPVEFTPLKATLPVHPYLMGHFLGKGVFRDGNVTLATFGEDVDEVQLMLSKLLLSKEVEQNKNIEALGLKDILEEHKFIPESYLHASIEERIALLQGLIDSAGCVDNICHTNIFYLTISKKLVKNIKELVGSLGGMVSISSFFVHHKQLFRLVIQQLPEGIIPVRLARKVNKYQPTSALRWKTIKEVTFSTNTETQCLVVDSKDNLYITDDYIVTHNCPRMAIIVAGGAVDETTKNTMREFFSKGKGRANAGRVLLLCVSSKNALSPQAKPPTVQMESLTVGQTEDGSFMKYQEGCKETIREAFRIATTFYGTSGDSNRASSYTLRDQTVEMVNRPESELMAALCNDTFTKAYAEERGLGDKLLAEIYFKTPRTMSEKDARELAIAELSAGALTTNDYRAHMGLSKLDFWWAELPRTLAVTALQMSQFAPAMIATMTDYQEFGKASSPTGDAETGEAATVEDTTKALIKVRQALQSALKHEHVAAEDLATLDKLFTTVKELQKDDEALIEKMLKHD